jgi:hypothetical protein
MTIQIGSVNEKAICVARGGVFEVDIKEAERLMSIGAVSIAGEIAPPSPTPAVVQPAGTYRT